MEDKIFSAQDAQKGSFQFDESVAKVFEDMIRRSVPGYGLTLEMIGVLAQKAFHGSSSSQIAYDLGCSLGASMFPILANTKAKVIGVDLSSKMLEKAEETLAGRFPKRYELIRENLINFQLEHPTHFIVSNFTLQFLPTKARTEVIKRCYDALEEGGILLISEKFKTNQKTENTLLTELHHTFKGAMGYSDLEIARKRDAIENVLIPETKETHLNRLKEAGFANPVCWYQCFNFASFLAVK